MDWYTEIRFFQLVSFRTKIFCAITFGPDQIERKFFCKSLVIKCIYMLYNYIFLKIFFVKIILCVFQARRYFSNENKVNYSNLHTCIWKKMYSILFTYWVILACNQKFIIQTLLDEYWIYTVYIWWIIE